MNIYVGYPNKKLAIASFFPSRQIFKRINFVFMKIFDFLVKICIFGTFLFFSLD